MSAMGLLRRYIAISLCEHIMYESHVNVLYCTCNGGVSMEIINKNNFEATTKSGTVLVDFFATWCGPCKMLGPVLEEVAKDMADKINVVKVDIDQDQDLAVQFNVMSVPTMILFKDGNVVKQLSGFMPKPQLERELNAVL